MKMYTKFQSISEISTGTNIYLLTFIYINLLNLLIQNKTLVFCFKIDAYNFSAIIKPKSP